MENGGPGLATRTHDGALDRHDSYQKTERLADSWLVHSINQEIKFMTTKIDYRPALWIAVSGMEAVS